MACPACGCKETYQCDDEDAPDETWERCAACGVIFNFEDAPDETWERCAACGVIFNFEDHADEEDEES